MADKVGDEINNDVENSESWENLSYDDWTILDNNFTEKLNTDDSKNEDNLPKEDEEPSRSMEVIETPETDTTENETESAIVEKHDEDSDGISIITESETEQLVVHKKFSEIDGCRNNEVCALKTYDRTGERTAPQVGTILNVVIACSLAAIIGLGAGRILGMDDKCPITNAVDFSTIKIESNNLINQLQELTEVKDVLDEIKASIPQVKHAQDKTVQRKLKSKRKHSERREKPLKITDTYIFDPDTTILEQLQTSLNTLYSVIDETNPGNDFVKSDTMITQGVVADLIEFKKIITNVVKELQDTGRPKEMEFLRHAEKRIRDVCESLLSDLSYAVHGMTMKIHHKLNKVRRKLNKRLCLLRNSDSIDERIIESFEENNSFLDSCDKILNVTLKPTAQSVKNKKNEKSDQEIHLKMTSDLKKRLPERSAFESEDDTYPKDSSSDSSMPDLTYDPDDNDFWKKNQIPRRGKKENKRKPGKIYRANNYKQKGRKVKRTEPMKSSLKNIIMEVLVPTKTCPLTQELWSESKFVDSATQRLESVILNQKPLYSTILKSVINSNSLVKSSLNEKKLSMDDIPEHTVAGGTQKQLELEVPNTERDSAETKHNVTPAESGINVRTMKNMKEQRNTNIQQPIGKQNRVRRDKNIPQWEEISTEKQEDSRKLENVMNQHPKHCLKGRKCPMNDSATTTASYKRRASTERDTVDNEDKNKSRKDAKNKKPEKIRDDHRKKAKKAKYEETIPISLKTEKDFNKRNNNIGRMNDQLLGDWQLHRSRAREMHRDRDHRSEWFFDRADSRQDARKNMDEVRSFKSRASRFSHYQPCQSYHGDKCDSIHEDKESDDYWHEAKNPNNKKHSNNRAAFTSKKPIKMPHRKNIMQSKRR